MARKRNRRSDSIPSEGTTIPGRAQVCVYRRRRGSPCIGYSQRTAPPPILTATSATHGRRDFDRFGSPPPVTRLNGHIHKRFAEDSNTEGREAKPMSMQPKLGSHSLYAKKTNLHSPPILTATSATQGRRDFDTVGCHAIGRTHTHTQEDFPVCRRQQHEAYAQPKLGSHCMQKICLRHRQSLLHLAD